jgi:aspartyl-tRNA(Asn)/glutamyl-tRNA(Gln) amidotransferase subunit C
MKINVPHVAKLANLQLANKDKDKFEKQLQETVDYVEELNKINTDNIEPTSQVTGLENVLREDIVMPSLSQKEALMNAKSTHNGFFKINAILNNE